MPEYKITLSLYIKAEKQEEALQEFEKRAGASDYKGDSLKIETATDDEGFPLCPVYHEKVLPDEKGNCSLCGKHSAHKIIKEEYAKA